MSANEKHAATYHGGEYTPMTMVHLNDDLTRIKHTYADSMRTRTGVGTATFDAEFDRMIAQVRAEAKAEALREAAAQYPVMLRDMVTRASVAEWLQARAQGMEQTK